MLPLSKYNSFRVLWGYKNYCRSGALVVEIWQEFLSLIREEVGSRVVETWLKLYHSKNGMLSLKQ